MEDASIDLVYILGSGSVWKNNEIRYSLRSVEKNLSGVKNVWVIGENPGFFTDQVRHIYYPDEISPRNADGNMARKILRACTEPDLSDIFLFMNDDFIIHKPIVASEIKWMHKGDFKSRDERFWTTQFYRYRLRRTYEILLKKGYSTLQYDYHAPMLMNKNDFPLVMSQFDYHLDIGYCFRSLYGNFMRLPAELLTWQKRTIYSSYSMDKLIETVKDCLFVGYNDGGLTNTLKIWLQKTFPNESKYEIPGVSDVRSYEVKKWFEEGCDYNQGVALFQKFTLKNVKLVKYFQSRHDPLSEKRLKITLNAWLH